MKTNNLFIKWLSLVLVLLLLLLTVGCGSGSDNSDPTSDAEQATTGTSQTDAQGDVVTDAPTTQTDAQGNVITTKTTSGKKTTATQGSTKVSYEKPAGNYNYIKDVIRYTVQYDCLAEFNKDKATLKVTHGGGPANFVGLFMDSAQTYVYRAKVTPSADGMLARLIFKGNSMTEHMYLAMEDGFVRIYDCADVYPGDAIVPIEILRYDAPNMKEFTFKGGKTYDVVIMTSSTTVSVWIDGKQYINNMKQSDLKSEGKEGDGRIPVGLDRSKYPMSRYLTDDCYMGAYYEGEKKTDVSLTLTNIEIYYPTAGMDKNYIDDGSDTNYQSTYKQKKFYIGAGLSFPPMYENGKKFTEMAKLMKGANLNLAIPFRMGCEDEFTNNPNGFYDAFEAAGLDFLACPESIFGVNAMNTTQIEKDIKALNKKYSHLVGYHIWDEPRTEKNWKVRKLGQLVTKIDPSKANYNAMLSSAGSYTWTTTDPDLKFTNYITSYINKVKPNVLSMDYYPFNWNGMDTSMKTNNFWKDMGYLTFQANKLGVPYWNWISGVDEWEFGTSEKMNIERIALQANGSLAYGCKGVLIFVANECIFTNDIKKSSKYDAMAKLNKETENIGNLLFNAKRTGIYHTAGYSNPAASYVDDLKKSTVISSAPSEGSGLILSTFTEGSKTYLVVVNKEYTKAVSGTIKLKKSYNVAEFNASTNKMGTASAKSEISINLGKSGIKVYQLT